MLKNFSLYVSKLVLLRFLRIFHLWPREPLLCLLKEGTRLTKVALGRILNVVAQESFFLVFSPGNIFYIFARGSFYSYFLVWE